MRVSQLVVTKGEPAVTDFSALSALGPQLVLVFGSVSALQGNANALSQAFKGAHIAGCSTAGEISLSGVTDASLVVTAIHFQQCEVIQVSTELRETVTFAQHNLISDPPFSKLDLISCRNLLI